MISSSLKTIDGGTKTINAEDLELLRGDSLPRNALAAAISAHVAGLDECAAGKLVDVIVGEIAAQLRAHREVYVPALGTFRLKRRAARTYRTPAGATVEAPAKTVVKVKTGTP